MLENNLSYWQHPSRLYKHTSFYKLLAKYFFISLAINKFLEKVWKNNIILIHTSIVYYCIYTYIIFILNDVTIYSIIVVKRLRLIHK